MNDELERRYLLSAAVIIVSNMLGTGGWLSYRSSFSSFSLPSLSLSYRCWKESSQGRDFKRRERKLIENVFRDEIKAREREDAKLIRESTVKNEKESNNTGIHPSNVSFSHH